MHPRLAAGAEEDEEEVPLYEWQGTSYGIETTSFKAIPQFPLIGYQR